MTGEPGSDDLARVLTEIQRRGGIGRGPIEASIEHARRFLPLLPDRPARLVDLGSGGGLPALVIAAGAPAWEVVLVERRAKRADLLDYGVRALGLGARVRVRAEDVVVAAADPELAGSAAVVTARSFGPPLVVLESALPFLEPDGRVLVSDPPGGATRWGAADLERLGMTDHGATAGIHRFDRVR